MLPPEDSKSTSDLAWLLAFAGTQYSERILENLFGSLFQAIRGSAASNSETNLSAEAPVNTFAAFHFRFCFRFAGVVEYLAGTLHSFAHEVSDILGRKYFDRFLAYSVDEHLDS